MIKFVFATIALFTSTISVCGDQPDGFFRRRIVSSSCATTPIVHAVAPVIAATTVAPIAVPVYVPVFQFQYQPPIYPVGGSSGFLSSAVVAPQGGFASATSVGGLGGSYQPPPPQTNGGTDNGPPEVNDPRYNVPPSTGTNPNLSALSVLNNRCAICHTGAASKGGVQIFTGPGQLSPTVNKQQILNAVQSGKMPKGAQQNPAERLSAQEIAVLRVLDPETHDFSHGMNGDNKIIKIF